MRVRTAAIIIGVALWAAPVAAQRGAPARSMAELAAEATRTTRAYRATLERALPIQEAQVRDALAVLEERRQLHEVGVLSAPYVEQAERDLATAERDLLDTQAALDEVERLLERLDFETALQERLARLSPLPRGGYEDAAMLVRFNGTARWSLRDVPALAQRFADVFGRSLPISSFGQTKVHDQLGLDHRNAIDVPVHPDSAEGRWLMQYLREAGIPFIGVRGTVPGASTGAHVHVGMESPRRLAR
jgi:hypothetical protein